MTKHFFRLGRWLLGREEAKTVRENNGWFDEAAEKIGIQVEPESAADDASATTQSHKIVPREEANPFVTHVPVYTLEAAAGKFGRDMDVAEEGWIKVDSKGRKLTEEMFAAHVVGHSMEPRIPDNSLCLFRANPGGSRQGKIVLVWHQGAIDPELGGEYSVKKYESKKTAQADGSWGHEEITLVPLNPDYGPMSFGPTDLDELRIIAEYLEVLE